ncbi:WD40 repeat-like protein [Imleria badia]|nr:WD40 repeat-like protein [Imleria badia]
MSCQKLECKYFHGIFDIVIIKHRPAKTGGCLFHPLIVSSRTFCNMPTPKAFDHLPSIMSRVMRQPSDTDVPQPQLVMSGHGDSILVLAYLPDGRRVVTGSHDGAVKVWKLENGKQERTSMKHRCRMVNLAVTGDGTKIISGDEDGNIKVWDVESHCELAREWTHDGGCQTIAVSPDDRLIAVGDCWNDVGIYTTEGTQVYDDIDVKKAIWSIAFSPNGNQIACGTLFDIHLYDVKTGKLILRPLIGHKELVHSVLWSRDGSRLFSASQDGTIRCWNSDTGEQIGQPWTSHTNTIRSLSLSPDRSILASASLDKTIRFWDATSGHAIGQPLQHDEEVNAVSFSPSGEFVAATTCDGKIYLWRVSWLDSVEGQTTYTTNDDMVPKTVQSVQVSLFPPPPYSIHIPAAEKLSDLDLDPTSPVRHRNPNENDPLSVSAMLPVDMPHILPDLIHYLEPLQARRTVPDFHPLPLLGAERLYATVRPIAPSTLPHWSSTSSTSPLAVELQYETFTGTLAFVSANFPPPPDLTPYIFKADHYVAGGSFGDVYRCWYNDGSPKEVAVKAFRFTFASGEDASDRSPKMLRRELGIWRRLNHKNVVPFLGIAYGFGMHGAFSLVSLWMPNESLHHFLAKNDNNLDLGYRLRVLLNIASGLHYCGFPIVHGDLNCNNVLLDADYTARLADFGYASMIGNIPEALAYLQRSTARPGTLRWIAPEQINSVLTGKQPWSEVQEDAHVVLRLARGHKPGRPGSRMIDDAYWNLIQDCWSSIEERPSAKLIIFAIQRDLVMSSSSEVEIEAENVTHAARDEDDQERNAGSISGASGSDRSCKSKKRRTLPAAKQPKFRVTTSEANGPWLHRVISVPEDYIWPLVFHPDGRRIVSRSDDGTIRVWNLESGEQEGASMKHCEGRSGHRLAVTRDGTRIISGNENAGSIRVWDVESQEIVQEWTHRESFSKLTISPDGLIAACRRSNVFIYTTEGRQVYHSIKVGKNVSFMSFSPTGDKLACGTHSEVYVYDVISGTLILGPLKGHKDVTWWVPWSRDGTRLVSASVNDSDVICCWNSDTGERIGEPWTHPHVLQNLSLSPDGSKLASTSSDTVRFWDPISGHPIAQHLEHERGVIGTSFSPSGEFLASATRDGKIYLWRVPWLEPIESRESHTTNLISILPDLSLGLDERQRIFEARLRKVLELATSKGFHVSRELFPSSLPVRTRDAPSTGTERMANDESNEMAASPMEPSTLVSGVKPNEDAKETHKVKKIKRKFVDILRLTWEGSMTIRYEGNNEGVASAIIRRGVTRPFNFKPRSLLGSTYVDVDDERVVEELKEAESGEEPMDRQLPDFGWGSRRPSRQLPYPVRIWNAGICDGIKDTVPVAYKYGYGRRVTGSHYGIVKILNVENGEQKGTSMEHKYEVYGLAVTRDGTKIISGGVGGRIKVWDVESHEPIREWTHEAACIFPSRRTIDQLHRVISVSEDDIWPLVYHPDGRRIVSRSVEGTIRVWNLESGEQEGVSMKHSEGFTGHRLAVTRDGTRIISGNENGSVRVWDVESQEIVQEWTHRESSSTPAISPHGLIAASRRSNVFIYTKEGRQVYPPIRVGKTISFMSFSPTGDKLACGTRCEVYVYDVENGTLIFGPLKGHKDVIWCVLWSRDGSRFVSTSEDEGICCWNSDTGERIGGPWTIPQWTRHISLSPDGSKLASSSSSTVRFWDAISGRPFPQHLEHEYNTIGTSFSPSGEYVASATEKGKIYLWRVAWLEPIESQESHTTNLNSILPDLSLGLDDRQHIFEVRLRTVLELATSKGFHVSRDLFPSSLPVRTRDAPSTGTERIANGESNEMAASPMEPSMLVSGVKSNGDAKETHKADKIKRELVDMLHVERVVEGLAEGEYGEPMDMSIQAGRGALPRLYCMVDRGTYIIHTVEVGNVLSVFPRFSLIATHLCKHADSNPSFQPYFPAASCQPSYHNPGPQAQLVISAHNGIAQARKRGPRRDVESHELIRGWTHERGCFFISIPPDDRFIAVADKTGTVYTVEGRLVSHAIEVDRTVCDLGMASSSPAEIEVENVTHAARDEDSQDRNVGSISGASDSDRPRKSKKRRPSLAGKQPRFRVALSEAHPTKRICNHDPAWVVVVHNVFAVLAPTVLSPRTHCLACDQLPVCHSNIMSSVTTSQDSQLSESVSDGNRHRPHRVVSALDDDIWPLVYHPDGRRIVSRSDNGTIRVWNLENGQQEGASMKHEGPTGHKIAVTSDGKRIISSNENGSIKVLDVESQEIVQEWTHRESSSRPAIFPDGLIAASRRSNVFIYTIEGGQVYHSIKVGKIVSSMSFSPSGDKLACGTDSEVYVYDVENGTLILGPLKGHNAAIWCVLWAPDGSRFFSASEDEGIRCWNSDTGGQIGEPWIHPHFIRNLSLSPDGSKLASASSDTVRFWDPISGHPIAQHLAHNDSVKTVSFSPSGEFVASATDNRKIYLWRVPWLEPIESPVQESRATNLNSILPDLSLGLDERQRIFEARLRKVLELANSKGFHVSRDLFPSSLPVRTRNAPSTGTEGMANGDSTSLLHRAASPMEPLTSVSSSKSNGDAKETHKADKITRKLVDMLRLSWEGYVTIRCEDVDVERVVEALGDVWIGAGGHLDWAAPQDNLGVLSEAGMRAFVTSGPTRQWGLARFWKEAYKRTEELDLT